MTLMLEKVRGQRMFEITSFDGNKHISWIIDPADVDVEVLQDIVNTVAPPPLAPTVPAIQVSAWTPNQFQPGWNEVQVNDLPTGREILGMVTQEQVRLHNAGAEAADRAAREEEQRLMNMGSALARNINMGPEDIPVFEEGMPDVNWGV